MEDCPVHSVEINPPYPFTCSCTEDYSDWNWKNVARSEYLGWAAWGEYHNWVRENNAGHDKYVKMLHDYSFRSEDLYRKWLLRDVAKKIREHPGIMVDGVLGFLEEWATDESYIGVEDREDED